NGVCYLVQTAHTLDWMGAIALARSDDYFTWSDAGPLYVHGNWHALESPFLMKRNGVYHLFFTEEEVGGVSHMSSDSLASGWNIVRRSIIDSGHAAEVLDLGSDSYIISRHSSYSSAAGSVVSSIRFDTLSWTGDEPYVRMTNLLDGWTVLWGDAFECQPVFGNNPRFRGDYTTEVGFEGNWWIGTYERFGGPLTGTEPGSVQGDEARGAIRSKTFTVTGYSMRLLVGGGAYPDSCYVALCDASSGNILLRATGANSDLLSERIWNLSHYRGKGVYLTIVDNCVSPFGHINVDGIEERMTVVRPTPNDDRPPGKYDKNIAALPAGVSSRERDESLRREAPLTCSPNPFNPTTRILVRSSPNAVLTLSIYDIAGRTMGEFKTRTNGRGEAAVVWNGTDRGGAPLPSGVYFAMLKDGRCILSRIKLVLAR
ncbi:MAG: T9SS type A sorting domain-containing protein, partial [Candidatus Krumholzibacteria bacterium]|nr:T9SS type A sorting domain-containing protein [Candidatus Krumholzibacteria bacterium]